VAQAPYNAYTHSMRAPTQSAEDAIEARNLFIAGSLGVAGLRYDHGGDWKTPFAQALHTLMDMTSPKHMENGVPIRWPSTNFLRHGDAWSSGENWDQ